MEELKKILLDNLWTILATAAAIASAFYAYRSNSLSRKALHLGLRQYNDKQSNFSIYLINSFRWSEKNDPKRRVLMFHCTITNKSENKNSFKCTLEIEYLREDNSVARAIVEHNPKLTQLISQDNFTAFPYDIRLEEKGIDSRWFLFEQPNNVFSKIRIEKYTIRLTDAGGNFVVADTFIMKDLSNEIEEDKN